MGALTFLLILFVAALVAGVVLAGISPHDR